MSKRSRTPLGDKIRAFAAGYRTAGREEYADGMCHGADVADAEKLAPAGDDRLTGAILAGLQAFAAALGEPRAGLPAPPEGMTRLTRRKKGVPAILEEPEPRNGPSTPASFSLGVTGPSPQGVPSPKHEAYRPTRREESGDEGGLAARVRTREKDAYGMGRYERALLEVLVERMGKPTTERQLSTFSGYSKSGSFYDAVRNMKRGGFAEGSAKSLFATDLAATTYPVRRLPKPGPGLIELWLERLGRADAALLRALVAVYPAYLTNEELAERSGYTMSGSFWDAMRKIRTMELTERHPKEKKLERASSQIMGEQS